MNEQKFFERVVDELQLCLNLWQQDEVNQVRGNSLMHTPRQHTMEDRFWLIIRLANLPEPYAFPLALDPVAEPERFKRYCQEVLKIKEEYLSSQ